MATSIKTLCVLSLCFMAGFAISAITTERDPQMQRIPQRLVAEAVMDDTDVAYVTVQPPAKAQEEKVYEVTLLVDFTAQRITGSITLDGIKYTVQDTLDADHVGWQYLAQSVIGKLHTMIDNDYGEPVKMNQMIVRVQSFEKLTPDQMVELCRIAEFLKRKEYSATPVTKDGISIDF